MLSKRKGKVLEFNGEGHFPQTDTEAMVEESAQVSSKSRGDHWGPMGRTQRFQSRGFSFNPWLRN